MCVFLDKQSFTYLMYATQAAVGKAYRINESVLLSSTNPVPPAGFDSFYVQRDGDKREDGIVLRFHFFF